MRDIIKKILNEAEVAIHFIERFEERFLNLQTLTVGFELEGTVGMYETVGTYEIPEAIKEKIKHDISLIVNKNYPKGKSFGIRIIEFNLSDKNVVFYSEQTRAESKGKKLVFINGGSESNGNVLYAIIRNNKLITFYFGKSYIAQTTEKLRVDYIIKSMDNLNKIR